jgi:Tfp pilus assembly protein PilV
MRAKLKHKSKRRCISARNKGMTLTEVVVASTLMLVAMIPMLKGLSNSHMVSAAVEQKTRALAMAQAKMDEIRARSIYDYVASFTENNTSLGGSYLRTVSDTASGTEKRIVTVSVGHDDNGNNILNVDETDVELSTIIAKRL